MRGLSRLIVGLLFLSLLSGCGHLFSYEIIEPNHQSIASSRTENPLRLVVGLSGTDEVLLSAPPFHLDDEFQELTALFAQRLQEFSLFHKVLHPVVPHDHLDLSLRVVLQVKFERDWAEIPKVFATQLLLGLSAPWVHREHHFIATGDLEIIHKNHVVRKYIASSDVMLRLGMGARPPGVFWQQAASQARDSMMADLLHQLNQDHGLLSQFEPSS